MAMREEPDTVVPYVRICGGTGGVIRPPSRLLTDTRRVNTRTLTFKRAFRGVEFRGFDKGRVSAVQA